MSERRGISPGRERAWDCATGTGQAAGTAAEFFARVEATDVSAAQLRQAAPHPRVAYRVAAAERAPFRAAAFDLVMAAQAAHWFDLPRFYAEALRVLRPAGVLAVWGYGLFHLAPEIDPVIAERLLAPIDPFWAEGNRLLMAGYASLPFPALAPAPAPPPLTLELAWTLPQFTAYLRTWSAVKRYQAQHGTDPVAPLEAELEAWWGERAAARQVRMPLFVRVGRQPG